MLNPQASAVIHILSNDDLPFGRHISLAANGALLVTILQNGAGGADNRIKAIQSKFFRSLYRWVRVKEKNGIISIS